MTTRLSNLHREYNYWYAGCGEMARFRDEDVQMALNICAARAGYSLRPLQEQVISFVQGSDVFVGLPTGSGKSLCYNILPDVFNSLRKVKSSIAVVIVLVPLMKDYTGTPHFMRLCLRAHAIDWCENSIAHSKRPGEFGQTVFSSRACVEKTGWFTRLVRGKAWYTLFAHAR